MESNSIPDVKPATIPVTPSVAGHPGSVTLPGLKPTSPATSPVPRPTGSGTLYSTYIVKNFIK